MPAPAITINGLLQSFLGVADAGASLRVRLNGYGPSMPRVSGTSLLADTDVTPTLPGDGTFSFTPWGNDAITPAATYYTITFIPSSGGVTKSIDYQFNGAGVFDLSTIAPYVPVPAPPAPPPTAVLKNPTGVQNITGFALIAAFAGLQVIGFSATPAFSAQILGAFEITLTGDVTLPTLSNVTAGQYVAFHIIQDGAGGRAWVWPVNVKGGDPVDNRANKRSSQLFQVGANLNLYPVAPMQVTTN